MPRQNIKTPKRNNRKEAFAHHENLEPATKISAQLTRLKKLSAELDSEGQARLDALSDEQRDALSRELIASDELREKSEAMLAALSALSTREFTRRLLQHFEQSHSMADAHALPSKEETASQVTKLVEVAFEAIRLGIALNDHEALHQILERRGLFDWEWLALGPASGRRQ